MNFRSFANLFLVLCTIIGCHSSLDPESISNDVDGGGGAGGAKDETQSLGGEIGRAHV